ncbi:fasciclin domain-containing protein [Maribacter halichondriae]|uniref:fasciclin domain-containing protein n=1 Tax=Maribacter halichondriae TaxID=2980554 RepID=UPI00235A2A20|nr:fasciclin domain-containing protein [Maribacter sp. Hal144]
MHRPASPIALYFLLFSFLTFAQTRNTSFDQVLSDPEKSIIANTESSKNYNTLLAAIRATDLEDLLDYEGPYTIFAPSDLAFGKLSENAIAELLKPENKKKLHQLVTYHIVAGKLSASKILKAMCRGNGTATFTTVQGDDIVATMSGIDIVLTDVQGNTARITLADADQCNGVIHEIDSVILPEKI